VCFDKAPHKYCMSLRKICPYCNLRPVAINYYLKGVVHYRSKCVQCYRRRVKKIAPPGWLRTGYKKKDKCEKCGFRFKHSEQANVYHIDGDTTNNDWFNLKTICANCAVEIQFGNLPWKPDSKSKLRPDF